MNKGKLMIFLSVMVIAAMLLASFAMIPAAGQAKAATSALSATSPGVPVVPDAPRNLVADQGPGYVWLWWDHPATQGDKLIKNYTIWRGSSSGSETLLDTIHVGATYYDTPFFDSLWLNGLNFYNDTTASVGPTYFYKIVAVSDSGSSAPSNEISATPSMTGSAPNAPSATGVGMTYSAQINWTGATVQAGSPPARFFYLYREGGFLSFFPISSSFGPSSYVDDASFFGAQLGELNNYTLMAANTYGQGAPTSLPLYVRGTGSLPSAPQNLTGFGGNHSAFLVWDRPIDPSLTGFDAYDVFRADTVGGPFHFVNTTDATFLGYFGLFFDRGLTNGATYQYKVRANNSHGGVGPFSNVFNVTPNDTVIPMEVRTLNAYPGNNKILLIWSYAYNATNYSVWRSESSGTETLLTTLGDVDSYLDTSAINGHTYFYKVKPIHMTVIGPFSPEASATASTGPAPAAPNLVATPSSDGVFLYAPPIEVTNPIIGFHVWREGVNIANESTISFDTGFTWSDASSVPDVNYNYAITAENLFGVSPTSNSANSFMSPTGDVPDLITNIHATGQNGGIVVSWDRPTYQGTAILLYYDIQRNSSSGEWMSIMEFTDVDASSQYTDQNVVAGVTYSYRITAVNLYGDASGFSSVASAASTAVNQAPSPPQNVVAVGHIGYVIVNWQVPISDGGNAITDYKVWRGADAGSITQIATVSAGTLTYNDTAVTNGQTYVYAVQAVNVIGTSAASNIATTTPGLVVPSAPQNVAAVGHDGYVVLTWQAPSSDGGSAITGYKVWRGPNAGSIAPIANVSAGTLTYNDTAVTNGQTYVYAVQAVNSVGTSPASNVATANPASIPGAPQNLTAAGNKGYVIVTWQAPSSDGGSAITGYKIWRGADAGSIVAIANVSAGTLTYNDTAVMNGQTYAYAVQAINAIGSSPASNIANASTPASEPNAPQSVATVGHDGYVIVTWQAPSSDGGSAITGYTVWRGPDAGSLSPIANVTADTLIYNDTAVTNGETYVYAIQATNAVGSSLASSTAIATPGVVPSAPQNLVAAGHDGYVIVTWEAPSSNGTGALTGYKLWRGPDAGSIVPIANLTADTLTYNDTAVTNGQTYVYAVQAMNAVGSSPASNVAIATPVSVPSAPQNLVAAGHNGYVIVTWQVPSSDGGSAITSYKVWRGPNAGSIAPIADVTAGTLTYNDTTVTNGQTYVYAVQAVNAVGSSAASNIAAATPGTVPGAPQNVVAAGHNGYVIVTWQVPSSDGGSAITGYKVWRGPNAGSIAPIADVSAVTLTYNDTTVTNGQTYVYAVQAVNSIGSSPASNIATATPASVPGAPQNVAAEGHDGYVTVTWSAPSSTGGSVITGYKVWRGANAGSIAPIATLSAGTLTYKDTNVTNGQTYVYAVQAMNAVGSSAASNVATATPESSSTNNNMLYAGIGVLVVIIVIIIIVWWYMQNKKKTPPKSP